jgi:hypothetical protein
LFPRLRNAYFLCILGGVFTESQSDKQCDNDYNFVVYVSHNCAAILRIWFNMITFGNEEDETSSPEKF